MRSIFPFPSGECDLSPKRWGVEYVNTCMQELFIMLKLRVEDCNRVGGTLLTPRKSHPASGCPCCYRCNAIQLLTVVALLDPFRNSEGQGDYIILTNSAFMGGFTCSRSK